MSGNFLKSHMEAGVDSSVASAQERFALTEKTAALLAEVGTDLHAGGAPIAEKPLGDGSARPDPKNWRELQAQLGPEKSAKVMAIAAGLENGGQSASDLEAVAMGVDMGTLRNALISMAIGGAEAERRGIAELPAETVTASDPRTSDGSYASVKKMFTRGNDGGYRTVEAVTKYGQSGEIVDFAVARRASTRDEATFAAVESSRAA